MNHYVIVIGLAFLANVAGAEERTLTRSNLPLQVEPVLAPQAYPNALAFPANVPNTPPPGPGDGLMGNRQISLTPFPNLYMQSGPLATDQLPWFHAPAAPSAYDPYRSVQFETSVGGLKSHGLNDSELGWYNSVLHGRPFWKEREVGLQLGLAVEPTSFPQVLIEFTGGFFHQAIWQYDSPAQFDVGNRISWGMVYDGLYDSENRVHLGQTRSQLGFALEPHREVGCWFALPLNDDFSKVEPNVPRMSTAALVSFYYRHAFEDWDLTLFCGGSESPGGAQFGGYLSYRFSVHASWTLSGVRTFDEEGAYALYAGLKIDLHPLGTTRLISGNPENRYRPFVRMADHINLQVRKRPAQ